MNSGQGQQKLMIWPIVYEIILVRFGLEKEEFTCVRKICLGAYVCRVLEARISVSYPPNKQVSEL